MKRTKKFIERSHCRRWRKKNQRLVTHICFSRGIYIPIYCKCTTKKSNLSNIFCKFRVFLYSLHQWINLISHTLKRKLIQCSDSSKQTNQCNICKRPQSHYCNFSRVKTSLFNQKLNGRLFNWLSFWWRKVLIPKPISPMYKTSNPKFCSFLQEGKEKV